MRLVWRDAGCHLVWPPISPSIRRLFIGGNVPNRVAELTNQVQDRSVWQPYNVGHMESRIFPKAATLPKGQTRDLTIETLFCTFYKKWAHKICVRACVVAGQESSNLYETFTRAHHCNASWAILLQASTPPNTSVTHFNSILFPLFQYMWRCVLTIIWY
jgi:hypothetical protein